MDTILCIIASGMLLVSFPAYLYVKIAMRSKYHSGLDDYYYEFEHEHPGLQKYEKWSKITFTALAVSILLLFIAALI